MVEQEKVSHLPPNKLPYFKVNLCNAIFITQIMVTASLTSLLAFMSQDIYPF